MLEGEAVNRIDERASIEYFGGRIPDRMGIILGVLDCTLESISIARRMDGFCKETGLKDFWLVLNKIESEETQSILMDELADPQSNVVGSISYDRELKKRACLETLSLNVRH